MKTVNKPYAGTAATGRPSLYTSDLATSEPEEIAGLLDALEPKRWARVIQWQIVILGVLLLATVAAYFATRNPDGRQHLSSVAANEVALSDVVPDETAPSIGIPNVLPEEPGMAPIIADGATEDNGPTTKTDEQPASTSPEPEATPQLLPQVGESAVQPARQVKAGDHGKQERHTAARAPAASKASMAGELRKDKDKDVDLIAALLSHVSHNKDAGKGKPIADLRAASASSVKRDRRAPPSSDIVVRNTDESTEVLVQRCRALGLIEGELCRIRICSGKWGADPACPANSAVAADQL